MIEQILSDILDFSVHYGAGAAAAGMLSVLVAEGIKKRNTHEKIYIAVISSYVFMVIAITLLSREKGLYQTVDLTLFDVSVLTPTLYIAHYLENFIMLIPFGFLLPMGIRTLRNPLWGMIAGMFVSSLIELSQYLTQLGTFAPDDIIANSVGSAVGFTGYVIVRKIYEIYNSIFTVDTDKRGLYQVLPGSMNNLC